MRTKTIIYGCALVVMAACTPGQKPAAEIPAAQVSAQDTEAKEQTFHVEGMTCDHCEMSIAKGVGELNGIISVKANHQDSTAQVSWNATETGEDEIIAAIEKRGYKVVRQ